MTCSHQAFWKDRWKSSQTPWDLGEAHPLCEELITLAEVEADLGQTGRFWVPGCGRGHEARFLADLGYSVLAEDMVPEAISSAHRLGMPTGLTYRVADSLVMEEGLRHSFDGVFDRAMVCALHPNRRSDYFNTCFHYLKPGGLFLGILFGKLNQELKGPPFSLSMSDLLEVSRGKFSVLACSEREAFGAKLILTEYLVILKKIA